MNKDERAEMLLQIWVRLDEVKNLTAVVGRGLDYEIRMEEGEVRSVLKIVNRLIDEITRELCNHMS